MPELPEVETARALAHRHLCGRRLVELHVRPDPIVFDGLSRPRFLRALRNRRVLGTDRKGKYFWLELDRRPWPLFHFGMSGRLAAYRDREARPSFWKLELVTDTGMRVALTNKRRLGRIRLRRDPLSEPPVSLLGFDAFAGLPRITPFREMLARRKAPIKALLLDQSFVAGVGNWIADEVLFQSGISPHRRACSLSGDEAGRLRRALRRVVRHAVRVGADDTRFPNSWLFHYRWGKQRNAQTPQGHRLEFATIGGRTTAWAPAVQR